MSTPGDPAEREADELASSFIEALSGNQRVSRRNGITPSAHRTAIALTEDEEGRCVAAPTSIPEGGESVNEIGIVMHDGAPPLRLRGSPSTTDDNIIGSLPFNTRVQIIKRFPGEWLFVSTSDGRMGYCAAMHVWSAPEHRLPDPDARLHRVGAGTEGTAIAIAQHYFADVADDWGQDLRFYVNVIAADRRARRRVDRGHRDVGGWSRRDARRGRALQHRGRQSIRGDLPGDLAGRARAHR